MEVQCHQFIHIKSLFSQNRGLGNQGGNNSYKKSAEEIQYVSDVFFMSLKLNLTRVLDLAHKQ